MQPNFYATPLYISV